MIAPAADGFNVKRWLFQQPVEHAPGERAVRPSALQCEGDRLLVLRRGFVHFSLRYYKAQPPIWGREKKNGGVLRQARFRDVRARIGDEDDEELRRLG